MKKFISLLLVTILTVPITFGETPFYQDLDNWTVLDSGLGPTHKEISSESFKDIQLNIDNFNKIGDFIQISPRLIAAQCFTEKVRQSESYRATIRNQIEGSFIKDIISGMGLHNFSEGLCSIKPIVAQKIENNLKDKNSPFYLGKEYENLLNYSKGIDSTEKLIKSRLLDDYWNILYAGIYLKMFQVQWAKAGFPINSKIDILSTLYNLGFYKSKPHVNPGVGGAYTKIKYIDSENKEQIKELYFGEIAENFYNSSFYPEIKRTFTKKIPDIDKIDIKYRALVEKYVAKGIIKGDSYGKFNPKQFVNRAEFLTILFRQLDNITQTGDSCTFNDIKRKDWFYPFVCKGVAAGYVKGYDNGKFGPGDNLILDHILILISRVLKDQLNLAPQYLDAFNKNQLIGLLKDQFDFTQLNRKITREETVFLLNQIEILKTKILNKVDLGLTQKIKIGNSTGNRAIYAYFRSNTGNQPNIGIMANIHGGYEKSANNTANYLIEQLEQQNKKGWFIIPTLNPDGLQINGIAGRANANGVDLNRNFCTNNFQDYEFNKKGIIFKSSSTGKCNSEIEIKNLLKSLGSEEGNFDNVYNINKIYSLHSQGATFYIPDGSIEDRRIIEMGTQLKKILPNYKFDISFKTEKEKRKKIYDYEINEGGSNKYTGSLDTYVYQEYNIPSILIELEDYNKIEPRLINLFN